MKRFPLGTLRAHAKRVRGKLCCVITISADAAGARTALLHESVVPLAEKYGDPAGKKIFSSKGDLLSLYLGGHCEREWNRRQEDHRDLITDVTHQTWI